MELILTLSQDNLDKIIPPLPQEQQDCIVRVCQRIIFPILGTGHTELKGLLCNCDIPSLVSKETYRTKFPEIGDDCFPLHFSIYSNVLATAWSPALALRTAKSLLVSYGCVLFISPIHEKEPIDREIQYWMTPRQWIWFVKRHGFTVLDQEINPRLDMLWIVAQVS